MIPASMQVNRAIVYQPFETFNIAVQVTPTQLSTVMAFTKADLIDSFTISVDGAAANNVFIGGAGVTVANGIEIVRGAGPVNFEILNQHQHYEIQEPLLNITESLQCMPKEPRQIPFVVWDFSQIYLIAIAITNVRIAPYRSVFI
jgi:hypothetical protein